MVNRNCLRPPGLAAAAFVLVLFVPALLCAQAGSLGGTVVDDDGNPVEGVEITVQPEASLSGQPRRLKTGDNGRFRVAGLTPGGYTLSYEKEGHESATQQVGVRIGERNRLGEVLLPRLPDDYVDPDAQVHFDVGIAASRDKDYAKAVESFLKVLDMTSDVPEVHYNLALSYERLEDIESAKTHYEASIDLRPDYYDPLVSLAEIHTRAQEWNTAADYLKRAIDIRPSVVSIRYNYGAVSMIAGDMDAARSAFEKVIELEPARALAHYQLGMIAVGQTKNEEAVAHLEKYLELEPEGAQAAAAQGVVDTLKKP